MRIYPPPLSLNSTEEDQKSNLHDESSSGGTESHDAEGDERGRSGTGPLGGGRLSRGGGRVAERGGGVARGAAAGGLAGDVAIAS